MKLYLIRHALPLIKSGVCYGATDMAADATATESAAQTLAAALPLDIVVICSPKQRCRQLAQCLVKLRPDLTLQEDGRLVEMDFGAWEGQCWDTIARSEIDAWTADFRDWRCGGAESVGDVMHRVSAALDQARANAQTVAWITHAGVIRAANLIISGQAAIKRADQWPTQAPGWGSWFEISLAL